jgi:hypothetical protein
MALEMMMMACDQLFKPPNRLSMLKVAQRGFRWHNQSLQITAADPCYKLTRHGDERQMHSIY